MTTQAERRRIQVTLGSLIAELRRLDPSRKVSGLGCINSYRGYYEDLAFDPETPNCQRTVGDLLAECYSAMGKVFCSYKGGDYLMGETTPLWVAEYGDCGDHLMGLDAGGDPIVPITQPEREPGVAC